MMGARICKAEAPPAPLTLDPEVLYVNRSWKNKAYSFSP